MIVNILIDLHNFLEQFLPPLSFFRKYQFSCADLKIGEDETFIKERVSLKASSSPSLKFTANKHGTILATFDILSYNINNVFSSSVDRRRKILRAIFSSGADIILLQETTHQWEDVLSEDATALQYNYRYFHHPGKSDRPAGGLAVLSQYPLNNTKVLDFSKKISGSVFPALVFDVLLPITEKAVQSDTVSLIPDNSLEVIIRVANVHLRPPVELDGSAWLDTARITEPIRVAEIEELLMHVQNEKSSVGKNAHNTSKMFEGGLLNIVAGDFNEGDDGKALKHMLSRGYIDALNQFVPRAKETHTWPFMMNFWTLRKRLDHVLWHHGPLSSRIEEKKLEDIELSIECLRCGVMTGYETGASDHQPVISRFAVITGAKQ